MNKIRAAYKIQDFVCRKGPRKPEANYKIENKHFLTTGNADNRFHLAQQLILTYSACGYEFAACCPYLI
jgi:hypothetical protein